MSIFVVGLPLSAKVVCAGSWEGWSFNVVIQSGDELGGGWIRLTQLGQLISARRAKRELINPRHPVSD